MTLILLLSNDNVKFTHCISFIIEMLTYIDVKIVILLSVINPSNASLRIP
jgi:hypothetical protein